MRPLFIESTRSLNLPIFQSSAPQHFDVLILGAGFTGLTAAWQLVEAGKRVAVMDAGEVAGAESGFSTAQFTEILDIRYHELLRSLGAPSAATVALSQRRAMEWAEQRIIEGGIACQASRVPGYLYCDVREHISEIEKECEAAKTCGVAAQLTTCLPKPFRALSAMRVDNQLQLHPRLYLQGIAKILVKRGCRIFEGSRATKITDGEPCTVEFANESIAHANAVVVATHTPVCNLVFLHTKIASYRSYVLGARLSQPLQEPGMYFDTHHPYHYTRTAMVDGEAVLLIGGEDHKTGDDDHTEQCFERLESYARERFAIDSVPYRWSGQIIETADGLPYIGLNAASKHLYVGTGYSGNGTTYGTLAGLILSDLVQGCENPFANLYRATRIRPLASASTFVSENINALQHFVADWLTQSDARTVADIPPGEGRVVSLDGKKCAVYRTPGGDLAALTAVCPHLGCIVHWNAAEHSWDCPCHGSRFDLAGEVLNGPATQGLKPVLGSRIEHAATET